MELFTKGFLLQFPYLCENLKPIFVALSRNHSYFQLNTGVSLKNQKKFSVFSELSLLIDGKEYVPDIAVYPHMKIIPIINKI